MEETVACQKCNMDVNNSDDLFDYEDISVCDYCFDELRRLDERVYQINDDFMDYE